MLQIQYDGGAVSRFFDTKHLFINACETVVKKFIRNQLDATLKLRCVIIYVIAHDPWETQVRTVFKSSFIVCNAFSYDHDTTMC